MNKWEKWEAKIMTKDLVSKKVYDEGTSSPIIARLFSGLLELRNLLYLSIYDDNGKTEMRNIFDKKHKVMFEEAFSAYKTAISIIGKVQSHQIELAQGKIAYVRGGIIHVDRTIDAELQQLTNQFIDQSIVSSKNGLQNLLRDVLELNIGFFFQKDKSFKDRVEKFENNNESCLSQYLQITRDTWHRELIDIRNHHEHCEWRLSDIQYSITDSGNIIAKLPKIGSITIVEYTKRTANRLFLFLEDMVVYGLQRFYRNHYYPEMSPRINPPIYLSEIPREMRDPSNPKRFTLAMKGITPLEPWQLMYKENDPFI